MSLEHIAEDLIASKLMLSGFFVAKPKFDIAGTDLICFAEFEDAMKYARIQCKGRSLKLPKSRTNVRIPVEYVHGTFVAFVYFDTGSGSSDIYFYTAEDIKRHWKITSDQYALYVNSSELDEEFIVTSQRGYLFNEVKVPTLRQIVGSSSSKMEELLSKVEAAQDRVIAAKENLHRLELVMEKERRLTTAISLYDKEIEVYQQQIDSYLAEQSKKIGNSLRTAMTSSLSSGLTVSQVAKKYQTRLSRYFFDKAIEDGINYMIKKKIV